MHDIKFLWQLHKDTQIIAKSLGISERRVIRELKEKYQITPPSRWEQRERRLRSWLMEITPLLITTSIWLGRKQDKSIKNQADAMNHRTGERFMVVTANQGKHGFKFDIGGIEEKGFERILLIGLAKDSGLLACAYYVPMSQLLRKKSVSIPNHSKRFQNYQISVGRANQTIESKKGMNI